MTEGKKQLHGGDLIVKALKNEGVDTIFSLSGGHINPVFDGCLTEGLRIIDTRHEQAAVHMAEGYARFTGRPGVAVVTAGPGVVNAVPAVSVAQNSGVPMVVIGGRSSLARRDIGSMQDMDQLEIMRPLTKWARSVYQVERLPEYVATAFRHAVTGSPGPVFLEVPADTMRETVDASTVRYPTDYCSRTRQYACESEVAKAVKMLAGATKPVIVAGSGVHWSEAGDILKKFAEYANIPVYTRNMGRGVFPEDHPLAGGFYPMGLMQADVVLVIGTRMDWTVGYGRPPLIKSKAKMIRIDIDPTVIGHNRPAEVGLPGDAGAVLEQMMAAAQGVSFSVDPSWPEDVQNMRLAARLAVGAGMDSDSEPIHPARLCREIKDFLPPEAAVVADGGDIAGFAVLILDALKSASLTWIGAFGHLGVGLPFAMAGKLAQPERPVVVISGDGSFGFSAMEFDTAVRHRIPIVCIVANDGGWGQIRRGQKALYGNDRVIGADLGFHQKYDEMVKALGGFGAYVEKPADIRPALQAAFDSGLPACINVKTDPDGMFGGMDLPWPIL